MKQNLQILSSSKYGDQHKLNEEGPHQKCLQLRRGRADFFVFIYQTGDALATFLGLSLGYWIRYKSGWITFGVDAPMKEFREYLGLISIGTLILIFTFFVSQLYDSKNILRFRQNASIILRGTTLWLFIYLGTSLSLKFEPPISRIYVASSYIVTLSFLLFWRWIMSCLLQQNSIAINLRQRILFLGWSIEAERLTNTIQQHPGHPYEVIGYIPLESQTSSQEPVRSDLLLKDTFNHLDVLLSRLRTDMVILANVDSGMQEIIRLANLCERHFVQFKIIPSYFQILVSGLTLETISGVPILGITELPLDRLANRVLKRTVDIIGSLIGLVASVPFIIVFGLLIYRESPGPIFFPQERIGRMGRRFTMYKLRTMKLGADKSDHLNQSTQRQDPRLLSIGGFLRRFNLDEIPQFWNVLRGEMSLVGPRPERPYHSEQLSEKIPHYNARYSSKPGMTGWAQVNGLRGDTSLPERVRFDLYYLEHWSLWLDFQIMALTFINRNNAY